MRWGAYVAGILLAACGVVGGCASKTAQPVEDEAMIAAMAYEPAVSTALVFDPPVTAGMPPVTLARGERQPTAYLGFEDLQTEFYYLRIDDNFTGDINDWGNYQRRSVTQTIGVRYR